MGVITGVTTGVITGVITGATTEAITEAITEGTTEGTTEVRADAEIVQNRASYASGTDLRLAVRARPARGHRGQGSWFVVSDPPGGLVDPVPGRVSPVRTRPTMGLVRLSARGRVQCPVDKEMGA